MKTFVYSVIVSAGALCAISCSDSLETLPQEEHCQEESYAIPIETALSSLEAFMIERGMVMTRGGMNDCIKDYFPVSAPATRASGSNENLLYVVNFNDDGGYALLAADSRIQEDILAITDKGSISESDFDSPILQRTPTDNDDLSVSEYEEMVASGVLAAQQSQINQGIISYASQQLETFRYDDVIEIGSPCDPSGPGGGTGGGTPYHETYSWKTVKEVPRMMETAWTQYTSNNDLFNKYCPMVGLIWRRKAPAGCVCIAVSQIMAYHEFPTNLICNGIRIDYPLIKGIYYYDGKTLVGNGTESSREMLARFCINVGAWCKIQYHSIFGESFGFAWPWDAKSCLETYQYKNVSLNWGYDENQVVEALDKGCPVFISAIAGFLQGHAWVIDGYIKREFVSDRGVVKDSKTLIHCNWGWAGDCNGYFTSGVFRTQEAEMYDTGLASGADEKYFCAFNTITYDNPKD